MRKPTITEIAAEKGCSEGTVRLAVSRGELEAERVGRRIYIEPRSAAVWRSPIPVHPKPGA